jgi:SAM-dependent methyltransferase
LLFKSALKGVTWRLVQFPLMGRIIVACWERRPSATHWNRKHPYDRLYRVSTSGYIAGFIITPGRSTAYGAAQPSIIRKALGNIPNPRGCHFVDLGCGKGRPLLIASEFHFAAITGVELSPTLCQIARGNAASVSKTHPGRTSITIVKDDALDYKLPNDPLLIFLYNPFDRLLMMKLIGRIEASLRAAPRDL